LASEIVNDEPAMAPASSRQFAWEMLNDPYESEDDSPFFQWLRDSQSVMIDWSTFGIEPPDLQSPC
jgi:hypothetical protein